MTTNSKNANAPKVGVITSIEEFLMASTEAKPLTKKQITDKLAKRFPDRDPELMAKTVGVQIPGRIQRERGVCLVKGENGFFLDKNLTKAAQANIAKADKAAAEKKAAEKAKKADKPSKPAAKGNAGKSQENKPQAKPAAKKDPADMSAKERAALKKQPAPAK